MSAWRKVKSKIIHKNPWYVLREDDVVRPDGKSGKYFYLDGAHSVAIIAEDENENIILVGQTRYPIGCKWSWEVPAGKLEKGESALDAAQRELREEAGIEAKKWTKIGHFFESLSKENTKAQVFLAQEITTCSTEREKTEDIQVQKKNIKEIEKMIATNDFFDGYSISALYKYLLYKKPK